MDSTSKAILRTKSQSSFQRAFYSWKGIVPWLIGFVTIQNDPLARISSWSVQNKGAILRFYSRQRHLIDILHDTSSSYHIVQYMVAIFEQTEQAEIDRDKVKSFCIFGENLGSKVLGISVILGPSF